MRTLEGQVVVITGGARGMGRSHALAAAERGARVALLDRCADSPHVGYPLATEADLRETEQLVAERGGEALGLVCDVGDSAATEAAVARVLETFGRVDVLVANAGVSSGGSIQDVDRGVWDETLSTNLTGVMTSMRAVAPHMIAQGSGRIVAIASMMGRTATPGSIPYNVSKWGVIGLVKSAAQDLAPWGITVNAVAPGNISTPMVHNEALYRRLRPDLADPQWDDVAPVLQRVHVLPVAVLDPQEITSAVMYLVGPEARYVSGAVLDVSGGASARQLG
ncbi:mycofactocin-coupled SDR family oxidoreductase [Blastococcus sp. SYSU D00820]